MVLLFTTTNALNPDQSFHLFVTVFFILGALANGLTIAVIGFLMEISPDDRRPAYSGYFNAITAPAFLLPLLAGIAAALFGLQVVFAISTVAAVLQSFFLSRIERNGAPKSSPRSVQR
jgi:MFS family permease